jgi:hypothetical protein
MRGGAAGSRRAPAVIQGPVRTTSRYAHLSRDRLREAVEMVPLGLAGA